MAINRVANELLASEGVAKKHKLLSVWRSLQGEDTDEVQNQPAWLRDDSANEDGPAENGGPPSLAGLPAHGRNASAGAADFVGLAGEGTPYANGDSHAHLGERPD